MGVGEEEQQLMFAGRSVDEEIAEDLSIIKKFGTCRCVHQARPQARMVVHIHVLQEA